MFSARKYIVYDSFVRQPEDVMKNLPTNTTHLRLLLICLPALLLATIALAKPHPPATKPAATTNAFQIGYIADPAIPESSGIVASRKYPGVFWTHNDSGNPPQIFAIDRAGKTIATFDVKQKNRDWEDIALDDAGHLFIGEIGNNNARHEELAVYQIDEPDPHAPAAGPIEVTNTWHLLFPDKPFDCESLFIWKDHGYVISKDFEMRQAGLYRFLLVKQEKPAVLEKVCDLPIRYPCTGADISRDGKQLAVITVCGPYLFDLPKAGDVSTLDKLSPKHVFYTDIHMEAVCFVEEGLLATSEFRNVYLYRWKNFESPTSVVPTTRPNGR